VRLRDVQAEYGDRVRVHWRAFPLIPGEQPGRRATDRTRQGWLRAGAEEPRAGFVPPPLDTVLPASSGPALTAAKCAERQGEAGFVSFHERLFTAQFRENRDIGSPTVLWALARECGLDMERFRADYGAGDAFQAVLRDCAEGAAWFGVSALPTVVFDEKLSLVGAVPVERYRALLDWILAGEPGGVIPLAPGGGGAPGQSAVAGGAPGA
jgi:predicted DsbA family dithiol-disulfide isomerase